MNKDVRTFLFENQDVTYQTFQKKLTPNVDNIIGVRLPIIRKYAKTLDISYLQEETMYMEEVMLQAFVIGNIKKIDEMLKATKAFLPTINNWSVCDSFVSSLKLFKLHLKEVFAFIEPYFLSENTYDVRFACVVSLNYFKDTPYLSKIIKYFDQIKNHEYYADMAIAWAISMFYIHQKKEMLPYIMNNKLNDFTHNKAISKICDSRLITKEEKKEIKQYKR